MLVSPGEGGGSGATRRKTCRTMVSSASMLLAPIALLAALGTAFVPPSPARRLARPSGVRVRAREVGSLSIDDFKTAPSPDDGVPEPLCFGITDSLDVPDELRPTVLEQISNPRDLAAVGLVAIGGCSVAVHNVIGVYGPSYELAQKASVCLGGLNVVATLAQLRTSYFISDRLRMGVMDDAALTVYAGLYSAAATWLALRTSTFCPPEVVALDGVLPWIAAAIFAYSIFGPAITLAEHYRQGGGDDGDLLSQKLVRASRVLSPSRTPQSVPASLSETELFRTNGLVFIGVLGCVFVPACLAFAVEGQGWWERVCALHPKQNLLESTDALFALFATEASMVSTRCAISGVAPYRKVVPVFAAVCLVLALVPCGCSLWWLGGGEDISFFSFYTA